MNMPEVRYGLVEVYISPRPEFVREFGPRVIEAGGEYSENCGSGHRVVTLPSHETGLIDGIIQGYRAGPKTKVILRHLTAEGFPDDRIEQATGHASWIVHYWRTSSGLAPSVFLAASFRKAMAGIDWNSLVAHWSEEDRDEEKRLKGERIGMEIAALRKEIALEAVRLLEGESDLGPLKEMARRYRDAYREAGAVLKTGRPDETPGQDRRP